MDKKTLLAIALCLLIIGVFLLLFPPGGNQNQSVIAELRPATPPPDSAPDTTPRAELPPATDEVFTIENDIFRAVLTTQGGSLSSLELKKFDQNVERTQHFKALYEVQKGLRSFLMFDSEAKIDYSGQAWSVVPEASTDQSITFAFKDADGLLIYKKISILPGSYGLEMALEFINTSPLPIDRQFDLVGPAGIYPETDSKIPISAVAVSFIDNKWSLDDETNSDELPGLVSSGKNKEYGTDKYRWIGIKNKYFSATFIPSLPSAYSYFRFLPISDTEILSKSSSGKVLTSEEQKTSKNVALQLRTIRFRFEPNGQKTALLTNSYVGPLSGKDLEASPFGGLFHPSLLSYGWFGFISKFLLLIMNLFYAMLSNYGVAIILLTLTVKAIMFPLTKKQYVSQQKMQLLSPKVKELKEKYAKDSKKFNTEMWKLYKEHGANPLSGCLPLLLQLPIFIGLYQALYVSIDLRLSPFVFWINDLANPEYIAQLSFSVLGTDKVRLLPIVMTVTWLVQMLTQPKSPDPQQQMQQKIFMFMPIVFGFICYSLPSGLVLYWFCNTLFSIIEQLVIKKVYMKA